jgi:branched-chain amino acid transport system ATP-binding protein
LALLEIDGLHTFYGSIEALSGVSLQVRDGEIVTLIGSNGAGKTTLLRTITALERARSGRVRFDGTDITRARSHTIVARGLRHVPEGRRVFAALTVAENLRLGGYLEHAGRASRLEHVYELFPRLFERRDQVAGTLSGGEQQMLAIGRALMTKTKLLALDEPSMGLAPLLVRMIFDTLAAIRAAGTAVLLVEQNARRALRLADRAYVLESGRIVLEGAARDLAEDPRVSRAYLGGDVSVQPGAG